MKNSPGLARSPTADTLFEHDVLVKDTISARQSKPGAAKVAGERRLLVALIQDAFEIALGSGSATDEERAEAIEWIRRSSYTPLSGFDWVCEELEMNPDTIREGFERKLAAGEKMPIFRSGTQRPAAQRVSTTPRKEKKPPMIPMPVPEEEERQVAPAVEAAPAVKPHRRRRRRRQMIRRPHDVLENLRHVRRQTRQALECLRAEIEATRAELETLRHVEASLAHLS